MKIDQNLQINLIFSLSDTHVGIGVFYDLLPVHKEYVSCQNSTSSYSKV
jgi:hypothetical protein